MGPFTADFLNLFLVFSDGIFRGFQYFFQFFKAFFRIFCTIFPKTHNLQIVGLGLKFWQIKLAHQTHNWIRHFCPYILFYFEKKMIEEKMKNNAKHKFTSQYIPYNFKESLNISNLYHFFTSKMVYVHNRKGKC